MRTYFVIIETCHFVSFPSGEAENNQVGLFCVMLLKVTQTTLRLELDPWVPQGEMLRVLLQKGEMTSKEPFATCTPPFAHEHLKITRVQRAKTFISYLLLFFGFRARRSFRWSPSRASYFPSASRVAVTDNRTGTQYPQTHSLALHTRRSLPLMLNKRASTAAVIAPVMVFVGISLLVLLLLFVGAQIHQRRTVRAAPWNAHPLEPRRGVFAGGVIDPVPYSQIHLPGMSAFGIMSSEDIRSAGPTSPVLSPLPLKLPSTFPSSHSLVQGASDTPENATDDGHLPKSSTLRSRLDPQSSSPSDILRAPEKAEVADHPFLHSTRVQSVHRIGENAETRLRRASTYSMFESSLMERPQSTLGPGLTPPPAGRRQSTVSIVVLPSSREEPDSPTQESPRPADDLVAMGTGSRPPTVHNESPTLPIPQPAPEKRAIAVPKLRRPTTAEIVQDSPSPTLESSPRIKNAALVPDALSLRSPPVAVLSPWNSGYSPDLYSPNGHSLPTPSHEQLATPSDTQSPALLFQHNHYDPEALREDKREQYKPRSRYPAFLHRMIQPFAKDDRAFLAAGSRSQTDPVHPPGLSPDSRFRLVRKRSAPGMREEMLAISSHSAATHSMGGVTVSPACLT